MSNFNPYTAEVVKQQLAAEVVSTENRDLSKIQGGKQRARYLLGLHKRGSAIIDAHLGSDWKFKEKSFIYGQNSNIRTSVFFKLGELVTSPYSGPVHGFVQLQEEELVRPGSVTSTERGRFGRLREVTKHAWIGTDDVCMKVAYFRAGPNLEGAKQMHEYQQNVQLGLADVDDAVCAAEIDDTLHDKKVMLCHLNQAVGKSAIEVHIDLLEQGLASGEVTPIRSQQ